MPDSLWELWAWSSGQTDDLSLTWEQIQYVIYKNFTQKCHILNKDIIYFIYILNMSLTLATTKLGLCNISVRVLKMERFEQKIQR